MRPFSIVNLSNNRLNISFEQNLGSLFSTYISFIMYQFFHGLEHWRIMTPRHKKHIAHWILMDPAHVLVLQILGCFK